MIFNAWWVCGVCGTRSPLGSPSEVDKAAERHVRDTQHPVVTHLAPS